MIFSKKRGQLHKKIKKNAGTTLVELIVSFMLLSLFMVAATKVIANTVSVYYQAKGIQTGMQVSNVITTKIVEIIEGALPNGSVGETTDNASVIITKGSGETIDIDKIELYDGTGARVYMTVDQDYLDIYYYPAVVEPGAGHDELTDGEHWTFDGKAYMGYTIKELKFSLAANTSDAYPGNVIRVDLTLNSPKYGDFSTYRYVQCYNFNQESMYSRIVVK